MQKFKINSYTDTPNYVSIDYLGENFTGKNQTKFLKYKILIRINTYLCIVYRFV